MAMRTTTFEERVTILTLANAGHSDQSIARHTGWKLSTVRKWRRRGQQEGLPGLVSKMGRPATGTLSTFPTPVVEKLKAMREAHPGWGPLTLHIELADLFPSGDTPARSTIARWLKEQKVTRPYQRHQQLPQPQTVPLQSCHQDWEMDAQGYQYIPDVGVITLINLEDRFSKVKLLSYPCWLGEHRASRHPNTTDYQLVFRLAASEWGLPDRLAVDRDSIFYDNQSASPFPTRFHLWLLALGVEMRLGAPNRPTERGMIERSHQTWQQQVLEGQRFANWEALWYQLQERRDFLNERLPCSTLGGVPPLVAHPEALRPRRLYRPEWESALLNLTQVEVYLSQCRWFRRGSNVGSVSLGGQVYVLGRDWARKEVVATFDSMTQCLHFSTAEGDKQKQLPIKGLTQADLMGALGPLTLMDCFQLMLPFTWDEWQVIRLCETLGDTT